MYCSSLSPLQNRVRFPTASQGSLGLSFRQFRGAVRAEQALAGDRLQPTLLRRCGYRRRLTRGVRPQAQHQGKDKTNALILGRADSPLGTVAPGVQPASTVAQRGGARSASGSDHRWGPRPPSWRTATVGAQTARRVPAPCWCPDPCRDPDSASGPGHRGDARSAGAPGSGHGARPPPVPQHPVSAPAPCRTRGPGVRNWCRHPPAPAGPWGSPSPHPAPAGEVCSACGLPAHRAGRRGAGSRRQGRPSTGAVPAQGMAEQGFAGDGKQPPLVPRCGSFPRLKPGVRQRADYRRSER